MPYPPLYTKVPSQIGPKETELLAASLRGRTLQGTIGNQSCSRVFAGSLQRSLQQVAKRVDVGHTEHPGVGWASFSREAV